MHIFLTKTKVHSISVRNFFIIGLTVILIVCGNSRKGGCGVILALTTSLSGWKKASLNLNFHRFCAIIKASKKRKVYIYSL